MYIYQLSGYRSTRSALFVFWDQFFVSLGSDGHVKIVPRRYYYFLLICAFLRSSKCASESRAASGRGHRLVLVSRI